MEEERHEVYERIPWETLEKQGNDRQWLAYAVAGAVVVGALAYTFMQNRPIAMPDTLPIGVEQPTAPVAVVPVAPATTGMLPLIVSEADLYAVDPERLVDQAAAHAEWFAVEYFGVDGSAESSLALAGLMPEGVPPPEAPEGVQVFVDWVAATKSTEVDVLTYEVEVVVRSLQSQSDGVFVRQPTRIATVRVTLDDNGQPHVAAPPSVATSVVLTPSSLALVAVPDDLRFQLEANHGPVVGGQAMPDGKWSVVVMTTDLDGVVRPTTIIAP